MQSLNAYISAWKLENVYARKKRKEIKAEVIKGVTKYNQDQPYNQTESTPARSRMNRKNSFLNCCSEGEPV
jgi:hypothetical protein